MKKEWVILGVIVLCLFLVMSIAAENLTLPKPPKSPYTPNGSSQSSSGSGSTDFGVNNGSDILPLVDSKTDSSSSLLKGIIILIVIIILVVVILFVLFGNKKIKKSQSSVIVSVLLIIVAIAAIAIVGSFTLKMVKDNAKYDNVDVSLSIDSKGTYYSDASGNIKDIYIRLKRGADRANLSGVILLFYSSGEAKVACNITPNEVVSLPLVFESRTYFFNSLVKPSEIQIYPIALINGENKILQASDKLSIKYWDNKTNVKSSDFDPLLNCIAVGGPSGSGNGPGDIGGMPF